MWVHVDTDIRPGIWAKVPFREIEAVGAPVTADIVILDNIRLQEKRHFCGQKMLISK